MFTTLITLSKREKVMVGKNMMTTQAELEAENRGEYDGLPLITIMFRHVSKQDHYYEDEDSEYGREVHTLRKVEDKIISVVCKGFLAAKHQYQEICESNADNPPYDEYELICAFETETNNFISLSIFEEVSQ